MLHFKKKPIVCGVLAVILTGTFMAGIMNSKKAPQVMESPIPTVSQTQVMETTSPSMIIDVTPSPSIAVTPMPEATPDITPVPTPEEISPVASPVPSKGVIPEMTPTPAPTIYPTPSVLPTATPNETIQSVNPINKQKAKELSDSIYNNLAGYQYLLSQYDTSIADLEQFYNELKPYYDTLLTVSNDIQSLIAKTPGKSNKDKLITYKNDVDAEAKEVKAKLDAIQKEINRLRNLKDGFATDGKYNEFVLRYNALVDGLEKEEIDLIDYQKLSGEVDDYINKMMSGKTDYTPSMKETILKEIRNSLETASTVKETAVEVSSKANSYENDSDDHEYGGSSEPSRPSENPEPSKDPEPSVDPNPSEEPEPSRDPEPSKDPEPSVDPDPQPDDTKDKDGNQDNVYLSTTTNTYVLRFSRKYL